MLTDFDSKTFRNACGQFLTGVTVVTVRGADGQPHGITVNSFASVSLEPPMVLFCIDKKSGSYQAMTEAEGYAVHILTAEQGELSTRFATRGADKFANLQWTPGLYEAPILPDTLAVFECRTVQRIDAGDHVILIGAVERLHPGDPGKTPLAYLRGRYAQMAH